MSPRPAGAHLRKSSSEWSEGERELMAADKKLAKLMKKLGPIEPERDRRGSREDPYEALARAICGQQLSTKAAATIWGRIEELFGGEHPDAEAGDRRRPAGRSATPGSRGRRSHTSATSPSASRTESST